MKKKFSNLRLDNINLNKLKEIDYKELINRAPINFIFVSFFFLMLFGRAFTGLIFFGFRLGELLIGLGLILSLGIFFINKDNKYLHGNTITNIHKLIIVFFLVPFYFSGASALDTYTYKSSTYIWTIAFIYLGFFLFKDNNSNLLFNLMGYVLPIVYFFKTFIFPNFIFNFFKTYGDRFDYIKASDVLLLFVLINFLNKKLIADETKRFYSFAISLGFFAPLMSFMSRGGFISLVVYAIIEFFQLRKFIIKNIVKFLIGLIILGLCFSFSTINVTSDFLHIINNVLDEIVEGEYIKQIFPDIDIKISLDWLNFGAKVAEPSPPTELTTEQILENAKQVGNRRGQNILSLFTFGSFSLDVGASGYRFYSEEPLANWRLQLWQDIIDDMATKDLIYTGYGYKEIIPAMTLEDNNGNDSTNENVHNYFVQSFARGGLIHLILLLLFHLSILIYWKRKYGNLKIIQYMMPVLLVSSFDPSMESVRFPLIYYTFLGFFLKTGLESSKLNEIESK